MENNIQQANVWLKGREPVVAVEVLLEKESKLFCPNCVPKGIDMKDDNVYPLSESDFFEQMEFFGNRCDVCGKTIIES